MKISEKFIPPRLIVKKKFTRFPCRAWTFSAEWDRTADRGAVSRLKTWIRLVVHPHLMFADA